jgi:spore coat polysaccharide biosynthesis predicted glycosyltransferase SpsG
MTPSANLRVLFRAPAGPRRGFGHVVRCLSLARALGVRPLLALRAGAKAADAALALGADLLASPSLRSLKELQPDVVVVDDPNTADARRWIQASRAAGARVVTLHDLGLGCRDADLVIDGSVTRTPQSAPRGRLLAGPRFAVLDPNLRAEARSEVTGRVLIALGGGPHLRRAEAIARTVIDRNPNAQVRIVAGFVNTPSRPALRRAGNRPAVSADRVSRIGPTRGLGPELQRASVAVVGGGVSLYEACALGVPAVTVPVVKGQLPTVRAFARSRAAKAVPYRATPEATAAAVLGLLADRGQRLAMGRRSRRLVDGYGAARAAHAVADLAAERGL